VTARRASVGLAVAIAALAGAPSAFAQDRVKTPVSCQEHVPPGATRPKIEEKFPERGFSGYAWKLEITVVHGKGETVLPEGFRMQTGSEAAKALEASGFVIPEADGGSAPSITVEHGDTSSTTRLSIPFVALPPVPGKVAMTLPPVPIAVARASGEILTLCTAPHAILIDEPIANLDNPKVAPNPDPRPQREEWLMAKIVTAAVVALALLGALIFWIVRRQMAKPKAAPVVPRKLPWVAALDELAELRGSTLLAEGRFDEYFDRTSDCVRSYLGARYGFDGLETTSDEMRALLKRVRPPVPELGRIAVFLSDCDLVKFARLVPTEAECREAVERGEAIVRMTTPPQHGGPPPPQPTFAAGPPNPGTPSRPELGAPTTATPAPPSASAPAPAPAPGSVPAPASAPPTNGAPSSTPPPQEPPR
jgi:hypothetical protein